MSNEISEALIAEAKDGLASGASVQILLTDYPTWLAVTELWKYGPLLHATLVDTSGILVGPGSVVGVRFGEVEEED